MKIIEPQVVEEGIFVFGSNEVGRHRSGAAKTAVDLYGAVMGQSFGLQGQSFAIPTKNALIQPLDLGTISFYISKFYDKVRQAETFKTLHLKSLQFGTLGPWMVTKIGCGLAGYTDKDMATFFAVYPTYDDLYFDEAWKPYLREETKFWGSYDE